METQVIPTLQGPSQEGFQEAPAFLCPWGRPGGGSGLGVSGKQTRPPPCQQPALNHRQQGPGTSLEVLSRRDAGALRTRVRAHKVSTNTCPGLSKHNSEGGRRTLVGKKDGGHINGETQSRLQGTSHGRTKRGDVTVTRGVRWASPRTGEAELGDQEQREAGGDGVSVHPACLQPESAKAGPGCTVTPRIEKQLGHQAWRSPHPLQSQLLGG